MIILDTNVISEIIKKQPDEHVDNLLRNQDTTFAFDTQAAANYATIFIERERRGKPTSIQDAMIAAIARSWGASVATRNTKDFEGTGVEFINPWEYKG